MENNSLKLPIPAKSKRKIVYEQLKEMIVRNQFPENMLLVERHLCEQLDASRTPIREAIQQLTNEDLVTCIPGKGAFVSEIRYEDIIQIFDVRDYLERLAGRLCISEMLPEELMRLESISVQMDTYLRAQDIPNYYQEDLAFHKYMVLCSRNRYLIRNYTALLAQIERITHLVIRSSLSQLEEIHAYHAQIVQMLQTHDPEGVETVISIHTQACKSKYLQILSPSIYQAGLPK